MRRHCTICFVCYMAVFSGGLPAEPTLAASCPPLYTLDGEDPFDHFGGGVAGVGDVNHDGCDDFIVGAVGWKTPFPDREFQGKVYLYSGLDGQLIRSWLGDPNNSGAFGFKIAGAGDVNNDGTPDVIVGAYLFIGAPGQSSGRVYVFSGETGETIWQFDGMRLRGRFGLSVAGAGDVNKDGYDDVVVGEPGENTSQVDFPGNVYLYSGATGELLWTQTGENINDSFGWSVSGMGDFDGDGTRDVVVGATLAGPEGRVYILSGVDGSVLLCIDGEQVSSIFGNSVSGVGDMDRDGFDDIVVGAYRFAVAPSSYDLGKVYVFGGPDGHLIRSWVGETPSFLGFSVSGAGDVNGDDVPDVVAGAYGFSGSRGKVLVYSGKTGDVIRSWEGEKGFDAFGVAVSGAGDVDGDGLMDVVVGADWAEGLSSHTERGKVYVYKPLIFGDCDCDQGIELADAAVIMSCMNLSASTAALPASCLCADFDADGDVDLSDYNAFQTQIEVVSDCCFGHASPGCDVLTCQDTVCPTDLFCCNTLWDFICADEAVDLCPQWCGN